MREGGKEKVLKGELKKKKKPLHLNLRSRNDWLILEGTNC